MAKASDNSLFIFFLLLISLLLTNIHFQSIYIILIVLFVGFLLTKTEMMTNNATWRLVVGFVIFYAVYAVYYFSVLGFGERYMNDLSKVHFLIILLIAFMIGSISGSLLRNKLVIFFRVLLFCMALIAAAYFLFDLHSADADGNRKLLTQYPYNRNHLDDLYLFQAFIASQATAFIAYFGRLRWFDILLGGALTTIYLACFLATESFGGLVGFFIGFVVGLTAVVVASNRKQLLFGGLLTTIVALMGFINSEFGSGVFERAHNTVAQLKSISVEEVQNYDSDFLDRCRVSDPTIVPVLPDIRKANPNLEYGIVVSRGDKQIAYSNPYVVDTTMSEDTAFLDATVITRLVLWRDAIRIWLHRPFLGHGEFDAEKLVNSYDNINSCNLKYFAHVHNYFLDTLIRGGVLLLSLYVMVVVLCYKKAFSGFSDWRKPILFGLPLMFITYLMVENLFDMSFIWRGAMEGNLINFALLFGLAAGAHNKQRETKVMDRLEKAIRGALAKQNAPDFETRSKIYKAAVQTLEKLPADEQESYRSRLFEVIKSVENEYVTETNAERTTGEYKGAEELPFYSDIEPDEVSVIENDNISEKVNKNSLNWVAAFVAVFFLGAIVSVLFATGGRFPGGGNTLPNKQASGEISENSIVSLYSINFPQDLDKIAQNTAGFNRTENPYRKFVKDAGFVVDDDILFFAAKMVPVDTSKVYLMRVNLKIVDVKGIWPRIQAGFATFDAEGNVQRTKPGSHRYFTHIGRLQPGNIPAPGDQIALSGVITGEGNFSHDMFRFGTKFARPVMIISMEENSSTFKIESLEVLELN